jgi:hypothetical protein
LEPLVRSEEFFSSGQGSIPLRDFLEPWGNLEVVVNYLVSPKDIKLNDIVTYSHISGSKHTLMSFKFILTCVGVRGIIHDLGGIQIVKYASGPQNVSNNMVEAYSLW